MQEPAAGAPRHTVIAAELRDEMARGGIARGAALPSEARLCERFGVSRGTVRQALATLRSEGLIGGGRGKPPVARRVGPTQSFDELVSFSAWALQLARTPGARTLELARRPSDSELAALLEIEAGADVFQYTRVRTLDGEPVMVERTTFVETAGALLVDCDLDGGSVYAQLQERGVEITEAEQTIEAIVADEVDAGLLEVKPGSPLLQVRRLGFGPDGEPVEWSSDRYRADAFAITLHTQQAVSRPNVALASA